MERDVALLEETSLVKKDRAEKESEKGKDRSDYSQL